jgi:hypothetical protein
VEQWEGEEGMETTLLKNNNKTDQKKKKKPNSIHNSVGNEENGYQVPDFN